jgi:hypothetical protein
VPFAGGFYHLSHQRLVAQVYPIKNTDGQDNRPVGC